MKTVKRVQEIIRNMSLREHFFFWGAPLLISVVLMFMYFFGPEWLQEMAAPAFNREFGLLENFQNVFLLLASLISFRIFMVRKKNYVKWIWLLVSFGALFIFLEEIDYGYHYIIYAQHGATAVATNPHNIHNKGNTNNDLRMFFYGVILVFIIILPYLPWKKIPALFRHFVGAKKLQFTVLTMLIVSYLAGVFNNLSVNNNLSLKGNISEFEELALYYLLFAYIYKLYQEQLAGNSLWQLSDKKLGRGNNI